MHKYMQTKAFLEDQCFSVSYCMVCANVRGDNPRALIVSGLSPVHTHNHTITALLHLHAYAFCALLDI